MTNKMPVVGKKYKAKSGSFTMELKEPIPENNIWEFWREFIELPEEPTNAKNAQVEEAKEELRDQICQPHRYRSDTHSDYINLSIKSQKLLNALDEQDKPEKDK